MITSFISCLPSIHALLCCRSTRFSSGLTPRATPDIPTFYTEHTVKLPDGIEIYYTDSGAPNSIDYTTLIVLHGSAFNGDGFILLHEFAHNTNLRVILWNRRDYRGSTKYTDEELADLHAGHQIFQDRLAIQLAWFLEHFVETKNIPKLSVDRKTGGFILMGWSFGNATTMSLFANPDAIPKPLYELIEPYIMSLVLYDPPYSALGYPIFDYDKAYDPWTDPDYPTPEQLYDNFQHWVSSYFKHPDIDSGRPSGLDYSKRSERCTIERWSDEQKERYIDKAAAVRTELPSYAPPMQAILNVQTHKVLFNEKLAAIVFPNVHVFYMACIESTAFCMWAYMESVRHFKEAVSRGVKVRQTSFHLVEGNHFFHYDNPELLLQQVLKGARREYEARSVIS